MRLLRKPDIESALPMKQAIALMQQAFVAISTGTTQVAERQVLDIQSGHALLMGAGGSGMGVLSKLLTIIPANRQRGMAVSSGLALLVDEHDGHPLAMLDATALTAWRTAAAAGFATSVLARAGAQRGLLIGSGTQARAQVLAMDAACELQEIHVSARNPRGVEKLIADLQSQVSATLLATVDLESVVREADVITTATTSSRPVLAGAWLSKGCHVNGIGSFRPDMQETDQALVERAAIFVESRQTSAIEAGELMAACSAGLSRVEDWVEMGEVAEGKASGRSGEEQITFYKSVGHALFDLYAAAAIYRCAEQLGLGDEWQA